MKKLIRSIVSFLVRLTAKYACETFGDIAELSKGPCDRCVGKEVRGVMEPTKQNNAGKPTNLSLQKAAQAWRKENTKHKVMDPDLAAAFAEILDEVWNLPWLGNATTGEMLQELKTRAEIHGYSNYKTHDPRD